MTDQKVPGRRRIKGSLTIVAFMLLTSAILRFGGSAGQALAYGMEGGTQQNTTVESDQFQFVDDEGLRKMITALQERDAALKLKERQIQDRIQTLQLVDAEVSAKINQLEQTEIRLRQTLTTAETAAKDDIERLTEVYESMKPKQAAALFEEMDPNFAAGFLGQMRPDAAAAIMAGLSSEAANLYSVIMAGRNANAPRD